MRTGVTVVGVGLDGITTLGKFQLRLWDDLVEGESTTAQDLASVAMAMEVSMELGISWEEERPYQRIWPCCSGLSSTVQVVWPQWHFPLYVVILIDGIQKLMKREVVM